jgi:hypothetical protein
MGLIRISFVVTAMLTASACATLMNSATGKMADNLTLAILNQGDLETVRSGAPAYLLMIDGLIQGSPDDSDLLLAGSKLYSSYTSAFIDDPERARRMSRKSFEYATRAVCADLERLCTAMEGQTDEFRDAVAGVQGKNLPLVYGLATAWTGWLQANSDDWNAVRIGACALRTRDRDIRRQKPDVRGLDGGALHARGVRPGNARSIAARGFGAAGRGTATDTDQYAGQAPGRDPARRVARFFLNA